MFSGIEQLRMSWLDLKTTPSTQRKPASSVRFGNGQVSATSDALAVIHPLKNDVFEARMQEIRFGMRPTDPDHQRYLDVVRGQVRDDLSRFKKPANMEVGDKEVEVPVEHIDLPRFTRGNNEDNTGQGDGEVGEEVGEIGEDGEPQEASGEGEPQKGDGKGKPQKGEPGEGEPGEEPADGELAGDEGSGPLLPDDFRIKLTRAEVARLMPDNLELPNFEERGGSNIQKVVQKYRTISKIGPQGLVNLSKTLKEYLRRSLPLFGDQLEEGNFDIKGMPPFDKTDFRYKDFKPIEIPKEQAVVFYVIDTSGSMQDLQKGMARNTNFFVSTYIQHRYGEINAALRGDIPTDNDFGEGVEEVFITHDAQAEQISEEDFYTKSKGSATNISSALLLIEKLIKEKYPLDQWNAYIVHYTDGDNSGQDNPTAVDSLKRMMEQGLNLYGYVETANNSSGTKFKDVLQREFGEKHQKIRASRISALEEDEFRQVMVDLLGKREED